MTPTIFAVMALLLILAACEGDTLIVVLAGMVALAICELALTALGKLWP